MSDVIYVLLTLAVFILLALLVGFLDRHSGATSADRPGGSAAADDAAADVPLAGSR